ncbi:MAG: hypothetical protein LBF33_02885 [Oscillospiraceae bacterium]|nr:hypothetical protein [Oscillospiraceae bacterium]
MRRNPSVGHLLARCVENTSPQLTATKRPVISFRNKKVEEKLRKIKLMEGAPKRRRRAILDVLPKPSIGVTN